jgi:transcriptional regulator with XRE-family HTH domain
MMEEENKALLKYPNYLLSTYQLEIYSQLGTYMDKNNLKKKDIAQKLNVSNSYVSQILNGKFNFTLKKLIQLGLAIDKVPYLEFVEPDEYWKMEKNEWKKERTIVNNVTYNLTVGHAYAKVDPEKFQQVQNILNSAFYESQKSKGDVGSYLSLNSYIRGHNPKFV